MVQCALVKFNEGECMRDDYSNLGIVATTSATAVVIGLATLMLFCGNRLYSYFKGASRHTAVTTTTALTRRSNVDIVRFARAASEAAIAALEGEGFDEKARNIIGKIERREYGGLNLEDTALLYI